MTGSATLLRPKRGRPSTARAEALDRHVIETARAMFLADGFDAVAMEQIALAAKISKGTLYARHASKEALFIAVVENTVQQWSEEASGEDYLLKDEIEARLRHHARTIAAWVQRPDVLALQKLILGVRDRFPEIARSMHDRGYRYIVDLIASDIRDAASRDGVAARDPEAVGELIVASISGRQMQDVGQIPGGGLDRFGQRVVDLVMASRSDW